MRTQSLQSSQSPQSLQSPQSRQSSQSPSFHGTITNIQRFSLDDGPGARTTVFLKGCSLSCKWCHNPETISTKKQLQYETRSCKSCACCVGVCTTGAQRMEEGAHVLDRKACTRCFACVELCPYGALSVAGQEITVDELGAELLKDITFYKRSGGGVTLSGGEPLLQADFAASVFRFLKEHGIHTALDTAGNVPWSAFGKVLPWVDLVLFDIKLADSGKHEEMTGSGNRLILENFRRLSGEKTAVWVRTPIVKGVNDCESETEGRIRILLETAKAEKVELLPFHRYGIGKYASLGMIASELESPSKETLEKIRSRMEEEGINGVIVS
ncbi:MAG: glycyl-radical enzyme activating protein [Treponema sp.]|jgi:pyruvate formate lyase activating enzyme|nr:glycyl-radical enzyme activating protein [Treponema sp.]